MVTMDLKRYNFFIKHYGQRWKI